MSLVFLSICLTIPLSGPPSAVVYPVVEVSGVSLPGVVDGAALPFFVLNEYEAGSEFHSEKREHELTHHRQMRNLGFVSFFAAYVLSLARPFEDYRNADGFMLDYPTYNSCGGFL